MLEGTRAAIGEMELSNPRYMFGCTAGLAQQG
jgi:hypothetical protein